MNQIKAPFAVLMMCAALVVASCGLTTSDEERMERAERQMAAGDYRAAMIELKSVLANNANNANARLMLAEVSLGLGDSASAEKELQRASELDAPSQRIESLNLQILLTKGAFTEALAALGTAADGLAESEIFAARGEALLGLGNADAAEATYREWLRLEPSSIDAKVGLANAQAAAGNTQAAVTSLKSIVEQSPEIHSAWHSLGLVLFQIGDFAGAEAAFQEAIDHIQRQANARRYASLLAALTETQLILGKHDEARLSLNRLSGVLPNAPMTLMLSARMARADNDYALASRHLQALLNTSPDNRAAQMFLANMQMMLGNFAQAETLLQRVVARSPDNLHARKLLAQVQLQRSQPGGAIEVLAPMLENETSDADLYTILAQASLQQGDTAGAIQRFREAAALDPEDMEAKLNLASAYLDAEEASLALEVLEQVPEGTGVLYRRQRLLMSAHAAGGDLTSADAIAKTLIEAAGDTAIAVGVVAEHFLRTGRMEEARDILVNFVAAHPEEPGAINALARIELGRGDYERAEELFNVVLGRDEDDLVALMGLAQIEVRAGNDARADTLLLKAARAHPRALGPRVILASRYLETGDLAGAERLANELVATGFQNARVSEVVATVLAEVGRMDEALTHFQQAVSLDPTSARTNLGLARAYLALDRSVDARQALNHALEINPGWPPAMTLLVLVEIRQGQLNDAERSVAEFRRLHPGNVTGMVLEGEVYHYKQDFVRAAAAFRRAVDGGAGRAALLREYQALVDGIQPNPEATLERWLSGHPDDTLARSFLAQHHQINGRGEVAVREYEAILEIEPDNGNVLNNLAWQFQQSGDLAKAKALAERAHAIDTGNGAYADTLGWIYYDLGQLEKSLELLSTAVRLAPNNAEIQFHYAVALADSGDKAAARQILERLNNSNVPFPSRDRAEKLLGQL